MRRISISKEIEMPKWDMAFMPAAITQEDECDGTCIEFTFADLVIISLLTKYIHQIKNRTKVVGL